MSELEEILKDYEGKPDIQVTFSVENGQGLQSTVEMMAKSFFDSGYFTSTHGIFPSNIADTKKAYLNWFDIRGNQSGFRGAKDKSQIVVAMYETLEGEKTPDRGVISKLVDKVEDYGIFVYDAKRVNLNETHRKVLQEKNVAIYELDLKELANVAERDNYMRNSIMLGFVLGILGIEGNKGASRYTREISDTVFVDSKNKRDTRIKNFIEKLGNILPESERADRIRKSMKEILYDDQDLKNPPSKNKAINVLNFLKDINVYHYNKDTKNHFEKQFFVDQNGMETADYHKALQTSRKKIKSNIDWVNLGRIIYDLQEKKRDLTIPRGDSLKDNYRLTTGNREVAFGAMYAGALGYFGYPITPATDVGDDIDIMFDKVFKKSGKPYIWYQAGSEIAASIMTTAAARSGVRVLTATSMPGFNNYAENFSLYAHTMSRGALWVDVQRDGDSTGTPTRTSDADLQTLMTIGGEFPRIILAPGNLDSHASLVGHGYNISDLSALPVIYMTNQWSGMNTFTVPFLEDMNLPKIDRGNFKLPNEVMDEEKLIGYARFIDGEVGAFLTQATPGAAIERGGTFTLGKDLLDNLGLGKYSEHPEDVAGLKDHRFDLVEKSADLLPKPIIYKSDGSHEIYNGEKTDAQYGLIVWSSSIEPAKEAQAILKSKGIEADILQLQTLYPIVNSHADLIRDFIHSHEKRYVVEQNKKGHLHSLLLSTEGVNRGSHTLAEEQLGRINKYDGIQMTADYIINKMK